jgi:hypothetical protein
MAGFEARLCLGLPGGTLSPTPVRTRDLRLVVSLDQLPLEDLLAAIAAQPAGVEVIAGKRLPAMLPNDSATNNCPGVHVSLDATIRPAPLRIKQP